ncbi:MAG: hypothetical protein RR014_03580 [Bilophila sp.]
MDSLPVALEAFRLPDERLGQAYEATSPEQRGWIKTTLALVEATYPALPSGFEQRVESVAAGYGNTVRQRQAPWTALVIGSATASPIRLAAAIMSARLAGVEQVLAIWTGSCPPPDALLATLELTGVEQTFALSDASAVLAKLCQAETTHERGRLLCFGTPADTLRETAHRLDIPLWEDLTPRLALLDAPSLQDAPFDLETIRWAHPDATPVCVTSATLAHTARAVSDAATGRYEALYAPASAAVPHGCAVLTLCPGLEGAWVCPDLPPSFFSNTTRILYRL